MDKTRRLQAEIDRIINLSKDLYTMKHMARFNNTPKLMTESVAEHSYYVAMVSRLLYDKLKDVVNIDLGKLLDMALCHDVSEIELSDIPHNVKMKYPRVKKALDKCEDEAFKRVLSSDRFQIDNDEYSVESIVVELADIISVDIYASLEIALGNSYFIKIHQETIRREDEIIDKLFEKINNERRGKKPIKTPRAS